MLTVVGGSDFLRANDVCLTCWAMCLAGQHRRKSHNMYSPLLGAAADAASVTATATTAFEAVTVLVVAIVGFFVVKRIIKKISG